MSPYAGTSGGVEPDAIALYRFQATSNDQLSIDKGAKLLIKATLNGWYVGQEIGREALGIFPANYVQKLEKSEVVAARTASVAKSEHINGARAIGGGAVEDEGSEQSYRYKQHASTTTTATTQHTATAASEASSHWAIIGRVTALYDFHSTTADTLSFNQGDEIAVVKDIKGWWAGSVVGREGKLGLVPSNYCTALRPEAAVMGGAGAVVMPSNLPPPQSLLQQPGHLFSGAQVTALSYHAQQRHPCHSSSPPHDLTLFCASHVLSEQDVEHLHTAVSSWKAQRYSSSSASVPLWLSVSFDNNIAQDERKDICDSITALASRRLVFISCKTQKSQFEHFTLLTKRYTDKYHGADLTRHWVAFLDGHDSIGSGRMECFMDAISAVARGTPPDHQPASYRVSQVITMPHQEGVDADSTHEYWQHALTIKVFEWFLHKMPAMLLKSRLADRFFCHSIKPVNRTRRLEKHPTVSISTISFTSAEERRDAAYICLRSSSMRQNEQSSVEHPNLRQSLDLYLADAGTLCSEDGFTQHHRILNEQTGSAPANLNSLRQCWQDASDAVAAVLHLPLIYVHFGEHR